MGQPGSTSFKGAEEDKAKDLKKGSESHREEEDEEGRGSDPTLKEVMVAAVDDEENAPGHEENNVSHGDGRVELRQDEEIRDSIRGEEEREQ